jgi:predicted phage terminase large subunit-like protein
MVCVPFVENFRIQKTQGPIAQENSVSITFTEPSRSADCCATTATSLLDTGKQKKHFSPQLATYEITLETIAEITESGYEDVFDIEVDRTGNFIANGLVSHNTRWHQEDLSGYLMNEHPDNWEVIKFPAIAEGSDVLGRIEGEALCPQRFTAEALLNIKCAMGSQMFAGLYQQRPAPMEGNLVKRIWFQRYSERPHRFDSVIQSWDMSFKETIAGSFVVGQVWGKIGANFYLLDQIRGRFSFVETQRHMISLCKRWPEAVDKLVEDAANGPAIISSLKDTVAGIIPVKATGSKAARLASVTGLIEAGNVFIPTVDLVEDADDLIEEICTFPYAAHDDQVDALSQSLSRLYGGGNSFNLSIPSVGVRSSPWNMSIS